MPKIYLKISNSLIFQNINFSNFSLTFLKMLFLNKNVGYNCKTALITRTLLECDIKFCYRNISIIRNVTVLSKIKKKIKSVKKINKIHMDLKKSMNSFELKERILIIY